MRTCKCVGVCVSYGSIVGVALVVTGKRKMGTFTQLNEVFFIYVSFIVFI